MNDQDKQKFKQYYEGIDDIEDRILQESKELLETSKFDIEEIGQLSEDQSRYVTVGSKKYRESLLLDHIDNVFMYKVMNTNTCAHTIVYGLRLNNDECNARIFGVFHPSFMLTEDEFIDENTMFALTAHIHCNTKEDLIKAKKYISQYSHIGNAGRVGFGVL